MGKNHLQNGSYFKPTLNDFRMSTDRDTKHEHRFDFSSAASYLRMKMKFGNDSPLCI